MALPWDGQMDSSPVEQLQQDVAVKTERLWVPGERQHQPTPVLEKDSASLPTTPLEGKPRHKQLT